MMKTMTALITFIGLLLVSSAVAHANTVSNVRSYDAPERLRIVLDLSKKPDYSVFTLKNPNRLVVDIADTKLALKNDARLTKSPRINSFRTSYNAKNKKSRIVFELLNYEKSNHFTLEPQGNYKHRLVIDLDYKASQKPVVITEKPADGKRDIVIAIDPGHGGEDPGSIGYSGTYEKTVTLKMSKVLADIINKEPGMTAKLTRTGDYYVRLSTRTARASKYKADLLISIHADAFTSPQPNGGSVWLVSNRRSDSEVGRVLEQKEKRSELLGGVPSIAKSAETDKNLAKTILSMIQTSSMQDSYQVSEKVLKQMGGVTRLHKSKPQHASLAVLTAPEIPSLLVETGFISNKRDEMNLNSRAHREKLMKAIFAGIKSHFLEKPPEGTLWANWKKNNKQHTVKRGESLSVLAHRYKVTVSAIKTRNKLRSDTLRIGQVLVIPHS